MLGEIVEGIAGLFGLGAPPRFGRGGGGRAFRRGAFGGGRRRHGHWRRPFFTPGSWFTTSPWISEPVYYEVPLPVPVEDPCIEASRTAAALLSRAGVSFKGVSPSFRTLPSGQECLVLVRTSADAARVHSVTGFFVHGFPVEVERVRG